MKSTLVALLTICLCLPLTGDDVAKKRFEETKVKAENGNEISQYNLGISYQTGIGVKQEFKQAVKWFRKSADQGFTRSQVNLGLMYDKGVGVKQDFKQAHSGELVAAGEMPLWFYVPLHPEADLTQEEIDLIVAWGKEAE